MRRSIYGVFLMLILLTILSVSLVNAQEEEDWDITGLVVTNNADVRIGPDFAYPTIDQLPINQSLIVVGRAGNFIYEWNGLQWLEIEYGGATAWIYARLVRTSVLFNDIPPTGMLLPRNRDGRVPDVFDLSSVLCTQWVGDYTVTGSFTNGDATITLNAPLLQGANLYRVYVFEPDSPLNLRDGEWQRYESLTNNIEIPFSRLPKRGGTYTWRVAPYWSNEANTQNAQQICLLQTGGTFEKPEG